MTGHEDNFAYYNFKKLLLLLEPFNTGFPDQKWNNC